MPCVRKTCQYVVHSDVMKMPTSWTVMPVMRTRRKKPASVARPDRAPIRNGTKICTLPIQGIGDGDLCRAMV